jgi:hypothetical protein
MSTADRRAPGRTRKETTAEAGLREEAQKLGGQALETLAALMADETTAASTRLAAAREVLDRGHGRPKPGGAPEEPAGDGGFTVILKRYSDVTDEERGRGEEGEP